MARSQPKLKQVRIDTYNSSSTGHQVGSGVSKPASWHRSRNSKLQKQFREAAPAGLAAAISTIASKPEAQEKVEGKVNEKEDGAVDGVDVEKKKKKIFAGCTIYVNGSTASLISDVELKRVLVANGAAVSTVMSRKGVSHVVLAKPVDGLGNSGRGGAGGGRGGIGGGLAAGKLQKEVSTKKVYGVRYVRVEWVLESIAAEKRLAESKYPVLSFRSGNASLDNMFAKKA
ncbi:hypothetical protein L873DRAFT_1815393 [Choiromyces venosus 120613-1]|uniref:BRCT domain-containing protein n=1 Tax=Choiromyces venosus 120613-1 TaxID=1336337 RepID=A0A3N4J691_9PEZI|nr:hypothetical protein L873DRAFT_1815393 [Choiromyces venosus 120613-1]